jgi:hypothetical protein
MSRRIFWLGVAIIVVGPAFVVTDAVLGPRPGPTEANARRVKKGMTLRDVEAILGGSGRADITFSDLRWVGTRYNWNGPNGVVFVWLVSPRFDTTPAVVGTVRFMPTAGSGLLERLRSFFSL